MDIAISGASGYIGQHLTTYLTELGHRVIPLERSLFDVNGYTYLVQRLSHCDAVINLAGASINHRWTPDYKRELCQSRLRVTKCLVQALREVEQKPKLMISASAVGYYPLQGVFDEYSNVCGNGFLAELCDAWEKEAEACPSQTRLVITRLGVVLSPDGGAMKQIMNLMKRTKLAAIIGSGLQPFAWIDIRDLCRAMLFILEHDSLRGTVNLVTPQAITQAVFIRAMAKAYRVWRTVAIPRVAFRLLYGERASVFTTGQVVRPARLLESGFDFVSPTIQQFFYHHHAPKTD